jgi:hypothetical protein
MVNQATKPLFKPFVNEAFKEIKIDYPLQLRYAISNFGRLISFTDSIENGTLLKGCKQDGYRVMRYKVRIGDKRSEKFFYFYKQVAAHFLPLPTADQLHVIHLDHSRDNDAVTNLKWVTKADMLAHHRKSPMVIEAKKKLIEHNIQRDGHKLTSTKVMLIKKRLFDPNRKTRLKMLAKQFGISEMQLHRIKTGENWGHIKI